MAIYLKYGLQLICFVGVYISFRKFFHYVNRSINYQMFDVFTLEDFFDILTIFFYKALYTFLLLKNDDRQ